MDTRFDELLEFPCVQNFKVMGVADAKLPDQVIGCLQGIVPGDYSPSIKPSSKGNYHAMSLRVTVASKAQMEQIYTELGNLDLVRVVI